MHTITEAKTARNATKILIVKSNSENMPKRLEQKVLQMIARNNVEFDEVMIDNGAAHPLPFKVLTSNTAYSKNTTDVRSSNRQFSGIAVEFRVL